MRKKLTDLVEERQRKIADAPTDTAPESSSDEQAFVEITDSEAEAAFRREAAHRRARRITIGLVVVALLIITAGIVATYETFSSSRSTTSTTSPLSPQDGIDPLTNSSTTSSATTLPPLTTAVRQSTTSTTRAPVAVTSPPVSLTTM